MWKIAFGEIISGKSLAWIHLILPTIIGFVFFWKGMFFFPLSYPWIKFNQSISQADTHSKEGEGSTD